MPDTRVEKDRVVAGDPAGGEADVAAGAAQLGTIASFVAATPATWPSEATGGHEDVSFGAGVFAETLAALAALRAWPAARGHEAVLPLHVEPEEMLGYKAAPGDPVTRVVTVPEAVAMWPHEGYRPITYGGYFGAGGRTSRTIISSVEINPRVRLLPSGREALEDVSRWTRFPHEALGALLGASRRSVYNWLRGRAMSSQFEARALRLRAALRPLAERRAPGEVAQWLEAGAVPPAELLREERWDDFEARVPDELMPRVAEPMPLEPEVGDPETYSAGARQAVLAALRTPPPVEQPRRPDWRPREVAGATPLDDEAE